MADVDNKVYVLVVHTSGSCFTLDQQYNLLHRAATNGAEVVAAIKATKKTAWTRITIKREHVGWLPSQPKQRPEWVKDRPESEFTAYWLEHHETPSENRTAN